MSLELLKATCTNPEIPVLAERLGANAIDIGTIIGLIQKYGAIAEQLLALVLPLVPAGALADVLTAVLFLLQKLVPSA